MTQSTLAAVVSDINIPVTDIVSPVGEQLKLVVRRGKEGLSEHSGFSIYEGALTYRELTEHFDVEANSDELDPIHKLQRDVDSSRVKNITGYLGSRKDTAFPSITIFVTEMSEEKVHIIGSTEINEVCLAADSGRLICDGQGRTFSIRKMLEPMPDMYDYTIGAKIIVTHTPTLRHAEKEIKQLFSDFNGNVKKPNSSISLYYDSATPYSRLLQELVTMPVSAIGGKPLHTLIAVDGCCAPNQLWTHKQFSDFVRTYLNATTSELNKVISNEECFELTRTQAVNFIETVMSLLPLSRLDDSLEGKAFTKEAMFTKALFATGLAYCGRSLVEDAAFDNQPVDWSKLDGLRNFPLDTLNDDTWIKAGITYEDQVPVGRTGKTKTTVKIMKGCGKKIGRLLTTRLRIMPCADI